MRSPQQQQDHSNNREEGYVYYIFLLQFRTLKRKIMLAEIYVHRNTLIE